MSTNNTIENLTVNEWQGLIKSIVKPFAYLYTRDALLTVQDMEQEAWTGLLVASQRYDPVKYKCKFTTYAHHYIRGYVLTYLTKQTLKPNEIDCDIENTKSYICTDAETHDLEEVIGSLVSDQKHSFLLNEYFVKNKSLRQIAKENNVSHETMAVRMRRLLVILQTRLQYENA